MSEKVKVHNREKGKEGVDENVWLERGASEGCRRNKEERCLRRFCSWGAGIGRRRLSFHCFGYFYDYHALSLKNKFSLIGDRYIDKVNGYIYIYINVCHIYACMCVCVHPRAQV